MTYVSALIAQADPGIVSGSTIERKKMSTKTIYKRIALVAVASLGFGLLTAVPSKALTGTGTATLSGPVRVSFTDSTRDTVAAQAFTFTNPVAAVITDGAGATLTMEVTQAPTSGATVSITVGGGSSATSDSLGASATAAGTAADILVGNVTSAATGVAGTIAISSNAASGTYKGTFTLADAEDSITISWSFTTTGKVASISTDVTAVNLAAVAHTNATTPISSGDVVVTLLDSTSTKTQPATGDSVVVSVPDATNIALRLASSTTAAASKTLTDTLLNTGSATATVHVVTATADSETVSFTPGGVMPSQGVATKTLVATTAAAGTSTSVVTSVTAPTSASVIKAGATATAKTADTSVNKVEFAVAGWPSGSSYKIIVAATDAASSDLSATINDVSGLTRTLYGISTGAAIPVVVSLSGQAASDTVSIDGNGDGDTTDSSDMVVTLTAATYAVTLTSPAVTPSISKTASALVVAGKIADSYSTAVGGATVSVSGAQTLSAGTASNLTGTATTAADGTFSVTLPAANALATVVALTVTAVKTGITGGITQATATVNLNASGGATALTESLPGDEDSATVKTAATQLPAVLVPYTGRASGISDEIYTVSSANFDGTFDANTETCFAVTVNSTPQGQIVVTGTAGVLFYTSACTNAATHDVSAGKSTVTIAASGSDNLWVTSTKTGLNTFTVTSGTVSDTYRFYAYNQIAAGDGHAMRNVGAPATAAASVGGISYLTLKPTDAFGNILKSVSANGGTITVKAAGGVLLDGPVLSRAYTTTDSDGNILIGIIAGTVEGAASITITSSSAQFGAAAGAATGTTAGTNGLTASTGTATIAVTVGGTGNPSSIATLTVLVNSLIAKINALNKLVLKIQKKVKA